MLLILNILDRNVAQLHLMVIMYIFHNLFKLAGFILGSGIGDSYYLGKIPLISTRRGGGVFLYTCRQRRENIENYVK